MSNSSNSYFHLTTKLLVLSISAALGLRAQNTTIINVNEPRPLWSALDKLEVASPGFAINYEDPPYENLADTQDSATPQQQAAHPGLHLIVPRAGEVTAEIMTPPGVAASAAGVLANINLLLSSYRESAMPGDFKVEQANGAIYVTPISILAPTGSLQTVTSPMTTIINIPTAVRSVPDAAQAIFDAVSRQTGLRFGVATFPFPPTHQVTFGASNETARDALAQLFHLASQVPVSYRLLFDPKPDTKRVFDYMVNVHLAGFSPPKAPANLGRMGPVGTATPEPQTPGSRPGATSAK